MALSSVQRSQLDSLSAKIAGGYAASARDRANLASAAKQGYKYTAPIAPADGSGNGTTDSSTQSWTTDMINQLRDALYPKTTTASPTFADSGLWNNADQTAMINQDYAPAFAQQKNTLQQTQANDVGKQLSDYYNRGLGQSGALVGNQQMLGQQQGLDTPALGSQQAQTVQQQRAAAYQNVFQNYLNRYGNSNVGATTAP